MKCLMKNCEIYSICLKEEDQVKTCYQVELEKKIRSGFIDFLEDDFVSDFEKEEFDKP